MGDDVEVQTERQIDAVSPVAADLDEAVAGVGIVEAKDESSIPVDCSDE